MALFGLFRKDPASVLARAEELLGRDEAIRALELLEALHGTPHPTLRDRATDLEARAHAALVASALGRAAEAEEVGELAEAAEWLAAAEAHRPTPEQQGELETRRASLAQRAAGRAAASRRAPAAPVLDLEVDLPPEEEDDDEEPAGGPESEGPLSLYLERLTERAAALYAARPQLFGEACLALDEGRAALARAALDELVRKAPDDAAYRLERGRCRLALGDAAGAREDLEAAWPAFGDEPLDLAGHLSVPALWAEALAELGEPEPVIERLRDLASPEAGNRELVPHYAEALLVARRDEELRDYLSEALGWLPNDAGLAFRFADVLIRLGERREAVPILEKLVEPCFADAGRDPAAYEAPLRLLASLYLDEGGQLDLAGGVLKRLSEAQGGKLTEVDCRLFARYYEAVGDEEAARRAAEAADRLAARREP